MVIERFDIDDPKKQDTKPFVRVSWGTGCTLSDCHCSDGHWISISDGGVGLFAKFDNADEMRNCLNGRMAEVSR